MSIIFDALRKIERQKKGEPSGCPPIVFSLPEDELKEEPRTWTGRHPLRLTALGILLLALAVVLMRPDWFDFAAIYPVPSAHVRSSPAAPLVIKEVRIEPRSILPSTDLPPQKPPEVVAQSAVPPPGTGVKIPELRLKGLSYSGNRSWVFINDRMLKVGDTIDGAEVVGIMRDRVKMRCNGVEFMLAY